MLAEIVQLNKLLLLCVWENYKFALILREAVIGGEHCCDLTDDWSVVASGVVFVVANEAQRNIFFL